jgi:hypothetical protein
MPTSGPKGALQPNTYLAGAAIARYRAVKRGADANSVIQAAAATDACIGISEDNQATVARALRVADRPGENVLGEAGAAFALDALLTSDANGRLVTAASTNPVVAIARQAAAALSDLVSVEIAPRGYKAP